MKMLSINLRVEYVCIYIHEYIYVFIYIYEWNRYLNKLQFAAYGQFVLVYIQILLSMLLYRYIFVYEYFLFQKVVSWRSPVP